VLLPVVALARRADVATVIGAGLEARAAGRGHRWIAGVLGRPAATVRGWLRRFASRAEPIRAAFTSLAVRVDPDAAPAEAASSPLGDAVVAVLAAAAAVGRRGGGRPPVGWVAARVVGVAGRGRADPWRVAGALAADGVDQHESPLGRGLIGGKPRRG